LWKAEEGQGGGILGMIYSLAVPFFLGNIKEKP
jgi:hypothetical protein